MCADPITQPLYGKSLRDKPRRTAVHLLLQPSSAFTAVGTMDIYLHKYMSMVGTVYILFRCSTIGAGPLLVGHLTSNTFPNNCIYLPFCSLLERAVPVEIWINASAVPGVLLGNWAHPFSGSGYANGKVPQTSGSRIYRKTDDTTTSFYGFMCLVEKGRMVETSV